MPAVSGLARVGDRRGLRVLADQAENVHQMLKPGTLFLPQGNRSLFLVGPVPFGLDRMAVAKAMQLIGWKCKPLQPSAPNRGKVLCGKCRRLRILRIALCKPRLGNFDFTSQDF